MTSTVSGGGGMGGLSESEGPTDSFGIVSLGNMPPSEGLASDGFGIASLGGVPPSEGLPSDGRTTVEAALRTGGVFRGVAPPFGLDSGLFSSLTTFFLVSGLFSSFFFMELSFGLPDASFLELSF